jgi:hypothetical protein
MRQHNSNSADIFLPTGRLLRLLASRHIYKEVAPDVFANNRISSALDTGKSSAEKFSE